MRPILLSLFGFLPEDRFSSEQVNPLQLYQLMFLECSRSGDQDSHNIDPVSRSHCW